MVASVEGDGCVRWRCRSISTKVRNGHVWSVAVDSTNHRIVDLLLDLNADIPSYMLDIDVLDDLNIDVQQLLLDRAIYYV